MTQPRGKGGRFAPRAQAKAPSGLREALVVVSEYLAAPRGPDHLAAVLQAAGVTVKDASNTYTASGYGLRGSATHGAQGALTNWCNAARRELAKGDQA